MGIYCHKCHSIVKQPESEETLPAIKHTERQNICRITKPLRGGNVAFTGRVFLCGHMEAILPVISDKERSSWSLCYQRVTVEKGRDEGSDSGRPDNVALKVRS